MEEMQKDLEMDFEAGNIILRGELKHDWGTAKMSITLSLITVLEAAAAATDNTIDDMAVEIIKKALSD